MSGYTFRPSVSFLRFRAFRTLALVLCLQCFFFAQSGPIVQMTQVSSQNGIEKTLLPGFEQNQGQWPDSVLYRSTALGYRASLTRSGLLLSPADAAAAAEEIELRWTYSNPKVEISGQSLLPYQSNYFVGSNPDNWKTSVPFFSEVTYRNVYPGVHVVYHGKGGQIEQDIQVEPGANPKQLQFEVLGASEVSITPDGKLLLKSHNGSFIFGTPNIYQIDEGGHQVQVTGHYVLQGSLVSFRLGNYNLHEKLTIDPVLSFSTYLPKINFNFQAMPLRGFSANCRGASCVTDGVALYGYDGNGNVVFTVADIFAAANVKPISVFRDEQGNCFVAGTGPRTKLGQDSFGVAKLSPTGSLIYTTSFSGGTGNNGASASQVVADSLGNAYLVGSTDFSDFPLKNPIQNLLIGIVDVVTVKLDPTGSNLIYSTYFGADNDGIFAGFRPGIAIDAGGNAYVAGGIDQGSHADSSIPVTSGVFQNTPSSHRDSWVAKIDPNGKQLYGTYLGGSADDTAFGIAADSSGNAYVIGGTCSIDFPTKNAFQSTLAANCSGTNVNNELSAFISKITSDGSALVYSTFLGGSDGALPGAIALDSSGAVYVTGSSSGVHFPLLNPIQSDFLNSAPAGGVGPGISQAFVTAFNSTGFALQYSTFLGGFSPDFPSGIGVDTSHNVYLGGANFGTLNGTTSLQSFPILAASNGIFQPFFPLCFHGLCGFQGFVAKISPTSGTALASPSTVDFGTIIKGQSTFAIPILIADVGSTDITINNTSITGDYTIANNTCSGSLLSSKHCEVDVIFSPTTGGSSNGMLTLTSNAPDSPRNIQLTGIGGVPIVSLNPTNLSLTSPSVGTAGPAKTLKLSNTGADVLNIASLTITGTNAADFSETHDCPATLSAGLSCNVNVTYKASTPNTETASLQFVDNAAGSPHIVPLTGTVSAFGLTIAPESSSSANVSAGQTAAYNLMIGGPGFTGNVTLSCTGAPAASTCNVPGSESLSSTPTNFQATVTTTARSTAALPPHGADRILVSAVVVTLFGLTVLLLLGNRRPRRMIALAGASLAVILLASCGGGGGGGGGSHGTPSGTFTIVVTATNGSLSQSMNLTLNVN